MKNSIIGLLLLVVAPGTASFAQSRANAVHTTKMTIQSIDKEGNHFAAHSEGCALFLDYSTGDFMFKVDAQTFVSGITSIDSSLQMKNSQIIVFKSNIIDHLFRFNHDENNGNMYNMQGVLSINGRDIPCVAQFDPMAIGKKNDTRSYRMDFRLTTEAENVTIYGMEGYLTDRVLFEIGRGKVNVKD